MAEKIKLDLVVQEMDSQSDYMSAFLHKKTKKIVFISEEEFTAAEDQEQGENMPDWLKSQIKTAEEILYGDSFIPLPSKFDINEYSIMEKFCLSLRDQELSDIMYKSIKGKGAFRNFKYNVRKYKIEEDWYKFKEKAIGHIAIDWCEANQIDYEK
ncbi:MAG: hypothetical protein GX046_09665 [Tissierellia bacterium]|nr:hypothetical protein [Tissierellia bacterium]